MELIKFDKVHFQEYQKWFNNSLIKNALYEIDEEWLDHVLKDKDGVEFAVFDANEMVGVVGVALPNELHPYFVITNIAVNPRFFGNGIGTRILEALFNLFDNSTCQNWMAYVEEKNTVAQGFFSKNGWEQNDIDDDMIPFKITK